MKQPKFTEKQLNLIGECVLFAIRDLRERAEKMPIHMEDFHKTIQRNVDSLNEILKLLADASHEK